MTLLWVDVWQEQVTGDPDGPGIYARRVRAGDREFLDLRYAFYGDGQTRRAKQSVMVNVEQARALLRATQRFIQEVEHEQQ